MPVDPADPSKRVMPMMTDADMAMKMDPIYNAICQKFMADPDYFSDTFARAWFKLTHRDMGPEGPLYRPGRAGGGPDLAGPGPGRLRPATTSRRSRRRSRPRPVRRRHGRHRMGQRADLPPVGPARRGQWRTHPPCPQKDWEGNEPERLASVLAVLEPLAAEAWRAVADTIVLAGNVGVEQAAKAAGCPSIGALHAGPGRRDGRDDRCRQLLGAGADRGRVPQLAEGGLRRRRGGADARPRAASGPDGPEMTVLIGGMRAMGTNHGGAAHGVFTDRPGALTTDFFVNLTDMAYKWVPTGRNAYDIATGRAARRSGPRRASISCSAPTPSCAPMPRSTPRTMRRRSSSCDFVCGLDQGDER
jgi:catalase-peroxidase